VQILGWGNLKSQPILAHQLPIPNGCKLFKDVIYKLDFNIKKLFKINENQLKINFFFIFETEFLSPDFLNIIHFILYQNIV